MNAKDKANRVQVRICDIDYLIKGKAGREHIERVASYVDKKMRLLSMKNPTLSIQNAAVLSAVNIADELLRLQEEYDALLKLLEEEERA